MKSPTVNQMRLAALWLNVNEGEGSESASCKAVAKWLNERAAKAELDNEIKAFAKRESITIPAGCFGKVRAALVKKFGAQS